MSLGWYPEEWAFSETKGAFTSWACPLQEFCPLCGVKLRKEPLAEKLVIPQVPKGSQGCENCLIQQGMEHRLLPGHRRSLVPHGDSPSPVFSLCSWCFFWWEKWAVTAGWIHHSSSWTLWRLENPHPSIELNITGSCGLCGISTAWGCCRMPFLWEKNILLFEASTADAGWSPPAMSELVLCVVWGFFIMFVLQVEIMFPSGRHLMAFVGGISFTQWWICCSEWECCLGLLKSGGGTLELSNASVVYMRLPRRKSNTFGKLCSQKQQQAGKKKGRSCEGACLNSGCVHVWWGARDWKCGRFAWQCRNQLCVLQQKRPEVGKKGELPPVIGATASGFPLWPPCSAGETSFGFGMSSCNSSYRGISLSRYFLQVLILKRSEGISGMHVGLGFLFGWFLVWRIQALSIFPQSCAFSCFQ